METLLRSMISSLLLLLLQRDAELLLQLLVELPLLALGLVAALHAAHRHWLARLEGRRERRRTRRRERPMVS